MYDNLIIKPVKNNNTIVKTNFNQLLKNDFEVYGIEKYCKKINNVSICNKNNIVNITNSTCIPNILRGKASACNVTNSHHIPTIDVITEGIILLNQFKGTISVNNEQRTMQGTYLITFQNSSIVINGTTYTSKQIMGNKILPPILQPKFIREEIQEHLSLELLKEIHINNTNEIKLLKEESFKGQIITNLICFGPIIGIAIVVTLIFCIVRTTTRSKIIINNKQSDKEIIEEDKVQNAEKPITTTKVQIADKAIKKQPIVPKRKLYTTTFLPN